jgi:hypothetical protein
VSVLDLEVLSEEIGAPETEAPTSPLPPSVDAAAFVAQQLPPPPELVWGILHRGSKLALGGGSKTFKTWTLIDLALAVSHGEPWLSFKTTAARVLFVNMEVQPWSFQSRIKAVAEAKHIKIKPGVLEIWNLRGHARESLLFQIERAVGEGYGLIILDPMYKLLGNSDENSARDITGLLNGVEHLAARAAAAIAFGAHFAKGNAAGKESIDRISGSGVFARDPDTILTFTRHEVADAFTVEATLRNFKPVEPFVARWLYPLMRRDEALDPSKLKQPTGRPAKHTPEKVLSILGVRKLKTKSWQDRAYEEGGIPRSSFFDLRDKLVAAGAVVKDSKNRWTRNPDKSEKSEK